MYLLLRVFVYLRQSGNAVNNKTPTIIHAAELQCRIFLNKENNVGKLFEVNWWQELFQQNYDWLLGMCTALGLTLVAIFIWRVVRLRLENLAKRTRIQWDDLVVESLSPPISWMITVIGVTWAADISAHHFYEKDLNSIAIVRQLSLLILIAWGIWRLINRLESRQIDKGGDRTTIELVGKISKLAVAVLIVLPVFQMLGISISGLLAFGGVGGLIVGMAARDLLANFFGSIIIYLDRPFKVGDWVRSPDRDIEGTVEKIGFRVTQIRTFDKRPMYVPNAVFTSISVENPSRMLNRRIYETIGVRYQDAKKVPGIIDDVKRFLQQHDDIDNHQTLIVNFNGFGASSLDFFIYTFTKTTDWVEYHHVKQKVLLGILDIIHEYEADCAFPTRTLHLESLPAGYQQAAHSMNN